MVDLLAGACARARVLGMRACAHTHVYTNEQVRARVGVCARAIPSVRACAVRLRACALGCVRLYVCVCAWASGACILCLCVNVSSYPSVVPLGGVPVLLRLHTADRNALTRTTPVTLHNTSIVDVRGGTAIRDDILLTARRTTLDKTFQTLRPYSAYAVAPIDNAFQTP